MDRKQRYLAGSAPCRLGTLVFCLSLIASPLARAQAPAASGYATEAPSPAVLEILVGRIALYPDDLVAIVLPASTNPLQVVQADRFLEKRKQDPKLPIDERWDDPVKALVNYPDVIRQMSGDLDWTAELGEAVVADQGAVLDAVQAFRRKVQSAGNLKTDAKQVVVVEKQVIRIEPADPQVIYVPQYNPSTVVVYSAAPVYGYWPSPYPVYHYPYPPGAALATGLVWGAAIGAAWNGGRWNTSWGGGNNSNNDITINRGDVNVNRSKINTGNVNTGNINRASQQPAGGGTAWKSDKRPGQVSSGSGRTTTTSARVGDATAAGGGPGGVSAAASTRQAGAGAAPARQAGGTGQGAASRDRPVSNSAGGSATRSAGGGGGGDAFGGYGSGSGARADSSRGAMSRTSMSAQGARAGAGGGGRGGGGLGGGGGGRGR